MGLEEEEKEEEEEEEEEERTKKKSNNPTLKGGEQKRNKCKISIVATRSIWCWNDLLGSLRTL